jgi:hypothetical protein
MKRGWKILAGLVAIFAVCPQLPLRAQIGPPLQVDVRVRVKSNHGFGASFERQLDPGAATVEGRIHNLPGGETAVVTLRFDYRTNADFALDEIISQIVISIENANGNAFSIATIDPNTIPLNPNRAPLYTPPLFTLPELLVAWAILHMSKFMEITSRTRLRKIWSITHAATESVSV